MKTKESDNLFSRAQKWIPGGVNSPARACKSVGVNPRFIDRGEGSHLFDADGNEYIDYVGSWGPLILGHRPPGVIEAVQKAMERGSSFGAPTDVEIQLAEAVCEAVPSIEMVRMVNSGTEATMSAVRLARGATGRDGVIKFDGCYHGHGDSLLVAAGSGVATLGIPGSPGIPADVTKFTLSLPFNDLETIGKVMGESGSLVACIIVEPVCGNMGVVAPEPGFLEGLRKLADDHGCVLIFDEVMTGFRVAYGGAQALYGVTPDLTCLGKVIGGGLPVGAYGGRRSLMEQVAPQGDVYQAGTLSGNPLAMSAGIAMLGALGLPGVYDELEAKGAKLEEGLKTASQRCGVAVAINRVGSMFTVFFTGWSVKDFSESKLSNLDKFAMYYNMMLDKGVYLPPSQFEANFLSTVHTDEDIDTTIKAAVKAFSRI